MRFALRNAVGITVTGLLAAVGFGTSSAQANPGDVWILGIHHLDNSGAFTTYPGAGYAGVQSSGNAFFTGNAIGRSGPDGQARVYWELSGLSVNSARPVPATAELFKVEFYGTTEAGHNNWQPVESQFHGAGGEESPIDAHIPWAGQFGTNHQYIAADGADDGQWHTLGPGPQADTTHPSADGTMMWLTDGSWLYSKWDFGFSIDRSWSALRLTQVTGVPEPTGVAVIVTGAGLACLRRRRRVG